MSAVCDARASGSKKMLSLAPLLLAAALVGAGTPTSAAEMVFACSLIPGKTVSQFNEADQVAIDVEAQTVDLRVARTMGTSDPVNWKFQTRRTEIHDDAFVVRRANEVWYFGGGTYGYAAHAFELRTSTLTWTFVQFGFTETLRWTCKP